MVRDVCVEGSEQCSVSHFTVMPTKDKCEQCKEVAADLARRFEVYEPALVTKEVAQEVVSTTCATLNDRYAKPLYMTDACDEMVDEPNDDGTLTKGVYCIVLKNGLPKLYTSIRYKSSLRGWGVLISLRTLICMFFTPSNNPVSSLSLFSILYSLRCALLCETCLDGQVRRRRDVRGLHDVEEARGDGKYSLCEPHRPL